MTSAFLLLCSICEVLLFTNEVLVLARGSRTGARQGVPCPGPGCGRQGGITLSCSCLGAGGQGQDRGPGKLTPFPLPLWTDKQTEKNCLPSYFVRGR